MASRRVPVLALSLLTALAALPGPAAADHLQSESGRTVSFDHRTGNEWWVEVVLGGPDAATAARVEGMDTGGAWTPLAKQSWGAYAASFHIEPGHQVRFRATWADGDVVTSCWFTHPAGVEQCPAGPTWSTTEIGEAGAPIRAGPGDMAVGDADNDGHRDVAVATGEAAWLFEAGSSGWTRETAYSMVNGAWSSAVAAGDGDGDGRSELYVLDGNELRQVSRSSSGWTSSLIAGFVRGTPADLTLGDVDGIAGPEVYAAVYDITNDCAYGSCTFASDVFWAHWTGSGWAVERILETTTAVDSLWVGDGDRDGRAELYVGHSTMHADHVTQMKRVSGAWQATAGLPGMGATYASAQVVVGDGDRDGRNEVYFADYDGHVLKDTYTSGGWVQETVTDDLQSPEGAEVSPTRLFLGDADGDGSQELYLTSDQGELYQIRWDGAAWRATRLAQPQDPYGRGSGFDTMLVVGDGDGDGRGEAYMTASFHMPNTGEDGVTRVYRVAVAGATPPPGGFDATFTGVRGNEWWEQAGVTATGGTLARVDVRIGDGAWQPLARQSWGGWAASYHAVDGTAVQFRATSTTGATDLSACYRWVPPSGADAQQMACPGTPPPPPPPSFDATFANAKGNEWWVQVQAAPNAGHTISAVQARVDGGAWFALAKQSWGPNDWAVSRHIPNGSKVQFQAIDQAGAADLSGCYQWIPPSGGLAASVAC